MGLLSAAIRHGFIEGLDQPPRRDLWRATGPELPVQPGIAWKQVRVPLLVHAWWLLFLLSLAVGIVASNLQQGASTLPQFRGASLVTLLGDVLILPAAVLACLVVNQITQRQRERAEQRLSADLSAPDQ